MDKDPSRMVLEAIVTTESLDGGMHVAPMGPHVDQALKRWRLLPFKTSTTFANLRRTNRCVVHVTDDVLLLVKAVCGKANDWESVWVDGCGYVLKGANRWFSLEVEKWDVSQDRATAECQCLRQETADPWIGWNRAQHGILELAILYSRRDMIETELVLQELLRTEKLVSKTGAGREIEALEFLKARFFPDQ